jgi:hypothetical protein
MERTYSKHTSFLLLLLKGKFTIGQASIEIDTTYKTVPIAVTITEAKTIPKDDRPRISCK